MQPLTKKQKQILDFLEKFIQKEDYAPSYREIGEHFWLSSVATVAGHIETLKVKGYLDQEGGVARSIQLTPRWDDRTFAVPLLGTIAAGFPIEAIRTPETIDIPADMRTPDVFALKVHGDSMVNDGILDGDYVIIEPTEQPKNGDIVVSLLDQDAVTLKRFYLEHDHVRLEPANGNYNPIRVKKVTIQGKVKGLIRKFTM
ncbi:transcriptional repressor LexA [Candidatus Berkelbacteria bacterium]|nr:transcriptional repressor LexA [Candidatus Berkelbacteria bacterium]